MRRIKLLVEYDGTQYAGWQRQKNAITIQELLENNLQNIVKAPVNLHGSGRTDSGVHALAQVAHFDTNVRMDAQKFALALNAKLPQDIRVKSSEEVDTAFHARFHAKQKHYRYTIDNAEIASALHARFRLHVHAPLNVPAMQQGAALLEGTHDFLCFMSAGSTLTDTVRTIFRSEVTQDGDTIGYDVVGNGFLYNMVRIIAGTLIEIGKGKYPPAHMQEILQAKNRLYAGATAPAHGLMLMGVYYD